MRIAITIIVILGLLFYAYKKFKAKAILGKHFKIDSFRRGSILENYLPIQMVVKETENDPEYNIWFKCYPEKPLVIDGDSYDIFYIRPKSPDDNINRRKRVICYFTAGKLSDHTYREFIDWATVIIVD